MTKPLDNHAPAPSHLTTVLGFAGLFVFVLLLGIAMGFLSDLDMRSASGSDYATGAAILAGMVVTGWLAWRWLRTALHAVGRPGSRTGKAQWITIGSLGIGVVLGILLVSVSGSDVYPGLLSGGGGDDALLPTWFVIGALVIMLVVVPIATVIYHRNADEHETRAMADGGLIAGYAYVQIAGSWWLAWRGGLAPEPDGYILFWGFIAVWLIVANYRKYF